MCYMLSISIGVTDNEADPTLFQMLTGEERKRKGNWTCYREIWIAMKCSSWMILKMKNFRKIKLKWISRNILKACWVWLFHESQWSTQYLLELPARQRDISIVIVGKVSPGVGNGDRGQRLENGGAPPVTLGYLGSSWWHLCPYLLLLQTILICESVWLLLAPGTGVPAVMCP